MIGIISSWKIKNLKRNQFIFEVKKSGNSYVHEGGKIFLWKRSQRIMIAGERIMGSFKKVGKNSKKKRKVFDSI